MCTSRKSAAASRPTRLQTVEGEVALDCWGVRGLAQNES